MRQLVYSLKETRSIKESPSSLSCGGTGICPPVRNGIARSGADIIAIDGYRGGTGAAPTRIRDNVGIPISEARARRRGSASARRGIRSNVSLSHRGRGIRSSADVIRPSLSARTPATSAPPRCSRSAATSPPLIMHRTVQLGHRHANSGACQAAGSRRRRGALVNLVTAWKREIRNDGRHGHRLHRGAARQPRDAPRHRPYGEGTRNPRRGSRQR